jgi:hypothetical protein
MGNQFRVYFMFPVHCREVGIKRVSFPLTEEEIGKNILKKLIYKRTEYIVLINGDERAVLKIKKPLNDELFSKVEDIDIISLPASTTYIEDPNINVLSPTQMAEKAEEMKAKTLVVMGMFEHISFIHKEEPIPLMVFDVIPPEPPKLVKLVQNALYSGSVRFPVKIIPRIHDLRENVKKCTKNNIVFPCHASELTGDKKTFYLDQDPEFKEEELNEISLIGCDLSLRIYKNLYKSEPEFYNFCPKKKAQDEKPKHHAITKCCLIKEGHERIGDVTVVPWGATQKEVEDALNELLISV